MSKPTVRALTIALILAIILGFIGYQKAKEIHHEDLTAPTDYPTENNPETQNEVLKYLENKYALHFTLWSATEQDLYAYHVYPDHADYECHILMPENTDDVEQYWNDLEWEIIDDELIIENHFGGEWSEAFKIDISAQTATSTKTGRVYQIYEMESPLE